MSPMNLFCGTGACSSLDRSIDRAAAKRGREVSHIYTNKISKTQTEMVKLFLQSIINNGLLPIMHTVSSSAASCVLVLAAREEYTGSNKTK